MHHLLDGISRLLAPIACHLAEELHAFRSNRDPAKDCGPSIIKSGWVAVDPRWLQPSLAQEWMALRELRQLLFKAIHEARQQGI